MIISFSVENWMSFSDRATLSMVASRERQHGERLSRLDRYQMRLVPAMALYGGNASGKTNLVTALAFAKELVVTGTQPDRRIPVVPYLLDKGLITQPSRFEIELLIENVPYALSFSATRQTIVDERLVRVGPTTERTLYHRQHQEVVFDPSLDDDSQFLHFAFRGTRENQLFLTNSVSQNVHQFKPIYDWFKDTLEVVHPKTRSGEGGALFFDDDHPFTVNMNEMLRTLDTGISHLGSKEVSFESLPFPDDMKSELDERLDEGESAIVVGTVNKYLVTREHGKLLVLKRVTVHPMSDGTETTFEVSQESDGSQRLLDLLPAFRDLADIESNKVYVIDEIDRSLHTLLTRRLLKDFLASCSAETRSQLLFTTHDVLLMDQRWFRRDEMWVTERDSAGRSTLLSFSEYRKVRHDKDIRKSYLQGRLGGVPRIKMEGPGRSGTKST